MRLNLIIALLIISSTLFGQETIGGSGNCLTDVDPNTITSINDWVFGNCVTVYDTANEIHYQFDNSRVLGKKWVPVIMSDKLMPRDTFYILADGQSNMVGLDDAASFSWTIDSSIHVWNQCVDEWQTADLDLNFPCDESGEFGHNNLAYKFASIYRRDNPNSIVRVLQLADQAITLVGDFNPTGAEWLEMKNELIDSEVPRIDVVLWHQGELDATVFSVGIEPQRYMDSLYQLIDRIEDETGTIDAMTTPFICGYHLPTGVRDYNIEVFDVLNKDSRNNVSVAWKGYGTTVDKLSSGVDANHFGNKSLDTLGAIYYETYLATPYFHAKVDSLSQVAYSNNYNDLDSLPSLPATITASNALNKIGNDIQLGGPLTSDVTITDAGFDIHLLGDGSLDYPITFVQPTGSPNRYGIKFETPSFGGGQATISYNGIALDLESLDDLNVTALDGLIFKSEDPIRFRNQAATGYTMPNVTGNAGEILIMEGANGLQWLDTTGLFGGPSNLWSTDATDVWRSTGDVGIGTSDPKEKLHTKGFILMQGPLDTSGLILGNQKNIMASYLSPWHEVGGEMLASRLKYLHEFDLWAFDTKLRVTDMDINNSENTVLLRGDGGDAGDIQQREAHDVAFSGNYNDLSNTPIDDRLIDITLVNDSIMRHDMFNSSDIDFNLAQLGNSIFENDAGYLLTEVDGSITNEIELPPGGSNGQVLSTNGAGVYSWIDDTWHALAAGEELIISNSDSLIFDSFDSAIQIEVDESGGEKTLFFSSNLTFSNGLTDTDNDITLGGTLTDDVTITDAGNDFIFKGDGTADYPLVFHQPSGSSRYGIKFQNPGDIGDASLTYNGLDFTMESLEGISISALDDIELKSEDPIRIRNQATTGFTIPSTTGSAGNILMLNGSDALQWVDTTGLFGGGGGSSLWSTDGTDVYRPTGDVGIGTSDPKVELHTKGVILAQGASDTSGIVMAHQKNTNVSYLAPWHEIEGQLLGSRLRYYHSDDFYAFDTKLRVSDMEVNNSENTVLLRGNAGDIDQREAHDVAFSGDYNDLINTPSGGASLFEISGDLIQQVDETKVINSDNYDGYEIKGEIGLKTTSDLRGIQIGAYKTNLPSISSSVQIGSWAGYNATNGYNQVLVGYYSGYENDGNHVTAVGLNSGWGNDGDKLTALGYLAGRSNNGDDVIAIGHEAGNTNDSSHVFLAGHQAKADLDSQIVFSNEYKRTKFNNYRFNIDQTLGASEDGGAMIYNNTSGELEVSHRGQSIKVLNDVTQNINSPTTFTKVTAWDATAEWNDGIFSLLSDAITVSHTGRIRIECQMYFSSTGQRDAPELVIYEGGSEVTTIVATGYVRNTGGHNHASLYLSEEIEVTSGDVFEVRTRRDGAAGTSTLPVGKSFFQITVTK